MASVKTVFYPRRIDAPPKTGASHMSLRNSVGVSTISGYYNSFDDVTNSLNGGLPTLGVAEHPTTCCDPLNDSSSSDHEREDDREDLLQFVENRGSCNYHGSGDDVSGHGNAAERDNLSGCGRVKDESVEISHTLTCYLIPSCVLKHWKTCRIFWIICIVILVFLILAMICIAIFWFYEVSSRSHMSKSVDLSTSEVYDLTSEFPLSNYYSNHLCLSLNESHSMRFTDEKIASVYLTSEDCNSVSLTTQNETISQRNSILGHNYMFYWLKGTTFSVVVEVNGTSLVTLFLLKSERSFDLCINRLHPEDYLMAWLFSVQNCSIITDTGFMRCRFEYTVQNSGYYYICVNSTILNNLRYNFSISSLVYDQSKSESALECTISEKCCISFKNIFRELHSPTCVFVTTSPLGPTFTGIRLSDISLYVDQRYSVIGYCVVAFIPLATALFLTILFYKVINRKFKNPDAYTKGCTLQCYLFK